MTLGPAVPETRSWADPRWTRAPFLAADLSWNWCVPHPLPELPLMDRGQGDGLWSASGCCGRKERC